MTALELYIVLASIVAIWVGIAIALKLTESPLCRTCQHKMSKHKSWIDKKDYTVLACKYCPCRPVRYKSYQGYCK